jgi:hypothetical protein
MVFLNREDAKDTKMLKREAAGNDDAPDAVGGAVCFESFAGFGAIVKSL